MSFTITVDYTLPGVFSRYRFKTIPGRDRLKLLAPTLQSRFSVLLWKHSPQNLHRPTLHNGHGFLILPMPLVSSSPKHYLIKFYNSNNKHNNHNKSESAHLISFPSSSSISISIFSCSYLSFCFSFGFFFFELAEFFFPKSTP